jgi:putative MATE family efflux protein
LKTKTALFETASIPRAVISFGLPMMLGMLSTVVYIIVDTFFVARTGDPNQVAAVTVCMPVFMLCMGLGNIFGVGGASYISRLLGEKDYDRVKKTSAFVFYASLIFAVAGALLIFLFMSPILRLIGTSPFTEGFSRRYLSWIAAGAPAIVLSFGLGQIVRSVGAAKEAMTGMIIGTVLNIILDPIMIFWFGMGVAGAAAATVIANVVSVIYYLKLMVRRDSLLSISPGHFSLEGRIVRSVLAIGVPTTLSELLMSAANTLLNRYASAYGDDFLAAMGIAYTVVMVPSMLVMGLCQGVQPLIGYTYTAKLRSRLKGVLWFTLLCATIFGALLAALIWLFGGNTISFFMDNRTVVTHGRRIVRLLSWSMPFLGAEFVLSTVFQSLGKAKQTLALSIARQGFVLIPLLVLFNRLLVRDGIILAQPVSDIASLLISVLLFMPVRRELNFAGDAPDKGGS